MSEANEAILKQLRISICGGRRELMIGKPVIRLFDHPAYVCFRVNRERNSIIVFPSSSKELMSFKVPSNLFTKEGRLFRITSKQFVRELVEKNGLRQDMNYVVPGTYLPENNVVVFNIKDAYEHSMSGEEDAPV